MSQQQRKSESQDKLPDKDRTRTESDIRKWKERISQLGEMEAGYRELIHNTQQDMDEITADMACASAAWVSDQARRGDSGGWPNDEPGPPGQEQRLYVLEDAGAHKRGQEHELRRVLMRKKEAQDALEQAQLILAMENTKIGAKKK